VENHGAYLLPYHVTYNAVKFDVKTSMHLFLNSHGLGNHVLNKQQVQLAATVDGVNLLWNVTQVSGGLKIVEP
jgi:hypothetical protein